MVPVSYTHLDVYKRQILIGIASLGVCAQSAVRQGYSIHFPETYAKWQEDNRIDTSVAIVFFREEQQIAFFIFKQLMGGNHLTVS